MPGWHVPGPKFHPNTAQTRHDGAHRVHVRSSRRLGRDMMAPQKKRVRVFLTLQNQTKYLRDPQKQAKKKEKTISLSQLCQTHFHHRLTLLWQVASIPRTQHTARTQDLTKSSGLLYFFHYPCLPTFSVSVWSPSSGHLYTQTRFCPLTRLRGHPCLFPQ